MSFLNALASSGLTVSLRLSNYLQRADKSGESLGCGPAEDAAPAPEPRSARPDPALLTPEERAAGRAEARAQLEAEGVLGRLHPCCGAAGAAPAEEGEEKGEDPAGTSGDQDQGPLKKLTPEEEAQVRKLAQRDQEVKTHEQAHVAAAGGLAGAPKYEYKTGPDGRRYAVGGSVSIRGGGGGGSTEQAIAEAETVKRAATAPAQPSSQDMAVAAKAEADIQRLKAKKAQEGQDKQGESGGPTALNSGLDAAESARPGQEKTNGAAFGSQVVGAYAAVKFGFQSSVRPLLARA